MKQFVILQWVALVSAIVGSLLFMGQWFNNPNTLLLISIAFGVSALVQLMAEKKGK